jgi:SAM-dependent methyltransferase
MEHVHPHEVISPSEEIMKEFSNLGNDAEFWDSPESVTQYSADSWYDFLFRGERVAFESCFQDGFMGRRVLDLGCGAGRTTHFLHEMGAEVVGVDISQNLIQAAQQHAPHIDFRVGDAESLDFDDAFFDGVLFSFNGLDCLYPKDRRLKSIREVWRVLRPEGRFVFSHHNLAAHFFGWYRFLKPWKLRFRAIQILNGNAFKNECYLCSPDAGGLLTYYNAWPKQVISDLGKLGFELVHIYPNSALLSLLQRSLRTDWFTKHADPWPYYVFRKTLRSS